MISISNRIQLIFEKAGLKRLVIPGWGEVAPGNGPPPSTLPHPALTLRLQLWQNEEINASPPIGL